MRKAIMPIVAMVLLVIGFFVGSSSGLTALAISAFCLWTPVSIWLGWAWAKAGIRLSVIADTPTSPTNKGNDKDIVKRAIKRVQEDMS